MRQLFLAVAVSTMLTGTAAQAATLDGDTFDVTYETKTRVVDLGDYKLPQFGVVEQGGTASFADNVLSFTFDQDVDFSTLGLLYVTLTDVSSNRIAGAFFEPGSLSLGILSTTRNSLTINVANVTDTIATGSTVGIEVGLVPLPATLPLFGGALLALVVGTRRRGVAKA